VDPVPDPLLFFLVVPGIEPGPPDLYPRTLATRPQRRSVTLSRDNIFQRTSFHEPAFESTGILVPSVTLLMRFGKYEDGTLAKAQANLHNASLGFPQQLPSE
jgi:hypothetical protein